MMNRRLLLSLAILLALVSALIVADMAEAAPRRVALFVAVRSAGDFLSTVPECSAAPAPDGSWWLACRGQLFLAWHRGNYSVPGKTGSWQLWLITPTSHEWRVGAALYRHLRRAALASPRVAGPWTARGLERLSQALADVQVYPQRCTADGGCSRLPGAPMIVPSVIAGDSPEALARADYQPTDQECTADTEPSEAALFPDGGQ